MIAPPLDSVEGYPFWEPVHLPDLADLRRLQATSFAMLFEHAYRHILACTDPEGVWVLADSAVDWRRPVDLPAELEIGTRVEAVGRTACRLAQALFQEGRCLATAETTLLRLDAASRQPTPIPENGRDQLRALTYRGR